MLEAVLVQPINLWNLLALWRVFLLTHAAYRIPGIQCLGATKTLYGLEPAGAHCTGLCLSMEGIVLMNHLVPTAGCVELLSVDLCCFSLLCVGCWGLLISFHRMLICLYDLLVGN